MCIYRCVNTFFMKKKMNTSTKEMRIQNDKVKERKQKK